MAKLSAAQHEHGGDHGGDGDDGVDSIFFHGVLLLVI